MRSRCDHESDGRCLSTLPQVPGTKFITNGKGTNNLNKMLHLHDSTRLRCLTWWWLVCKSSVEHLPVSPSYGNTSGTVGWGQPAAAWLPTWRPEFGQYMIHRTLNFVFCTSISTLDLSNAASEYAIMKVWKIVIYILSLEEN